MDVLTAGGIAAVVYWLWKRATRAQPPKATGTSTEPQEAAPEVDEPGIRQTKRSGTVSQPPPSDDLRTAPRLDSSRTISADKVTDELEGRLLHLRQQVDGWITKREAAEILENREAADRADQAIRRLNAEADRVMDDLIRHRSTEHM